MEGGAFRLAVGGDGLATLTFDLPGKAANIFNQQAVLDLERTVAELARRSDIQCLVLLSGKPKIFIAGADIDAIAEVTDPALVEGLVRRMHELFAAWETLPFPTVAAIRGVCLGGGLELSLASTYIVASDRPDIRIGLPETRLGIVPGWGGCVRLPRRIGIAPALDIILAGKTLTPKAALKAGLLDALFPDAAFLHLLREFALARRGQRKRKHGGGDFKAFLLEKNPLGRRVLFDQARKKTLAATKGQYPAPLRAIEVVRVGIESGRAAGFDAEVRANAELATSPVCKNLIHVFRLMEDAKKDGGPEQAEPREVAATAVIGAGVMGGGIGQLIADQAALPVRLRDIQPEALASGLRHAAQLFEKQVERRRLTRAAARRKMALLQPTLELDGLRRADLVIEAVVEKLDVKQKVFADLALRVEPEAVLASNTSSLSIDAIARDTPNPERVVGMHFFNPVHKMPLVEVIMGRRTSPRAASTVAAFARRLGKTPVMVGDGPGFLVNRLLAFYMSEAMTLVAEGHGIDEIDAAMVEWGMPMGPIALTDEVGIDVAVKVAHILGEAFGERLAAPPGQDKLIAAGRLGAKNGSGFYRYEERKRTTPDPEVYALLGLNQRVREADSTRLVERMVLPMVNEAARCLEERVVAQPGHLDLAMIMGTGFPPFRGGLCRWADGAGLKQVVKDLERLAEAVGARFAPAPGLRRAAEAGGFYAFDWHAPRIA
jgi:3-hydroxyacyl-CoA dehydrogenase/enoyl-CoA hydratase/3-hydroxybutyryl-CoA epimerase